MLLIRKDIKLFSIQQNEILRIINQAKDRIIFVKNVVTKEESEIIAKKACSLSECVLLIESLNESKNIKFIDVDAIRLIIQNKKVELFFIKDIPLNYLIVDNIGYVIGNIYKEIELIPNCISGNINYFDLLTNTLQNIRIINETQIISGDLVEEDITDKISEINKNSKNENNDINLDKTLSAIEQEQEYLKFKSDYRIIREEVYGSKLSQKQCSINQFYKMVDVERDLNSSYKIFDLDTIKDIDILNIFREELEDIKAVFNDGFLQCGYIGKLIKKETLDIYKDCIEKINIDYKEYVQYKINQNRQSLLEKNNMFEKYEGNSIDSLIKLLVNRKDHLVTRLYNLCINASNYIKFINRYKTEFIKTREIKDFKKFNYSYVCSKSDNQCNFFDDQEIDEVTTDKLKELLGIYIDEVINFPDLEDILNGYGVSVHIYEISKEMYDDNILPRLNNTNKDIVHKFFNFRLT